MKKLTKLKNYMAIFMLALSWALLFWLTGSRVPWQHFARGGAENGISIFLGDIPTPNYDRMGFTKAVLRYSEAEAGWIVGTERGELFLFADDGRQLWKRTLGIGKLISLCLSADGSIAFVGEQSPEGNIYAINARTGDILWKRASSAYIGADPSQRSYPSVVHIVTDKDDNVYANAYRFLMRKDGVRAYSARMLALSKTGKMLWQFPEREAMDSWINWCDVSDAAGRAVLSTSAYDFRPEMRYKDTLYFIDKRSGAALESVFVPAVPPFDNTVLRGSPNFSGDGKFMAACASDGRGFLFDERGGILWQRWLSQPTQVDGAWINASGRDGFVVPGGVLFTTINTYNRENWQLPTPVEHPSCNSLFAFDRQGKYLYQYQAAGTMEELAFAGNLVACAIGRNVRTHNYRAHGALVLDLASGREEDFFATEGPCQTIAISADGKNVAGVEAPAVLPDGKILGAYRLHLWQRKER